MEKAASDTAATTTAADKAAADKAVVSVRGRGTEAAPDGTHLLHCLVDHGVSHPMRSRHRCCFAVANSVCVGQRRHRSGSGLGFPMGPLRPPGADTVVACGFVAGSHLRAVATPVAAPGEGRGAPARYYSPGTPPGTSYVMRARAAADHGLIAHYRHQTPATGCARLPSGCTTSTAKRPGHLRPARARPMVRQRERPTAPGSPSVPGLGRPKSHHAGCSCP